MLIVRDIPAYCARGGRILDLGAGTGRNAVFLARQGYEVEAIDVSPEAIAQLRAATAGCESPVRAEVMNACSPDIDFSQYRVVVCTFMLHFLDERQAIDLLARARAQAVPGTLHAIAAFCARGEIFDGSSQRRFYYPEPGALAGAYRAARWMIRRDYEQSCTAIERRTDGTPKTNLASFVLASL